MCSTINTPKGDIVLQILTHPSMNGFTLPAVAFLLFIVSLRLYLGRSVLFALQADMVCFIFPFSSFLLTKNFPEARHNLVPLYAYSPRKLAAAVNLQVLT